MRTHSSIRVRWVMRFAGTGTADVMWIDRSGRITECVRIHGSCVDSSEARRFAKMARDGKELPSYVEAYVERRCSHGRRV